MTTYSIQLGFQGDAQYQVTIDCDPATLQELKTRLNAAIRQIVDDGEKRFKGVPVKKEGCGC